MDISLTRASLAHGGKSHSLPFPLFSTSQQCPPSNLSLSILKPISLLKIRSFAMRASSSVNPVTEQTLLIQKMKNAAKTVILATTVAALTFGRFSGFPARADAPETLTEKKEVFEEEEIDESDSDYVDALKAILQTKLDDGENEEALKVLKLLAEAQPSEVEWKLLMASLMSAMGEKDQARKVYEEILTTEPSSFEALFENALLMDNCGEGEAALKRLEEASTHAVEEQKSEQSRDARLIMAQIQFLQMNVDEALKICQQLAMEDPKDFRPCFCQGLIFSLLDRKTEAREQFVKYYELSQKQFEVEEYLRIPLTIRKLLVADSET